MSKVELLAPAGSVESFEAALDAGADAIYVGAPGLNARNLARDLRLEEIAAMIHICHRQGKRLFIAANSLIFERELPQVVEQLALLKELKPDALIVQDLGIIRLARKYFPTLTLHASTLMLAHNADAVRFFAELGCRRVVLARELTMPEIASVIEQNPGVEIEVFIHGAMCFSYSGLCLFSSYLGGKSGLRGRCVQPCRRAYTDAHPTKKSSRGRESGQYLFSMNDLCGLEVLPELMEAGVTSLKIEGRMRSAHYVHSIVSGYRQVLDADPDARSAAIGRAKVLVEKAMGRSTSTGYFLSPQPAGAITWHHSGNMGLHLGRFSTLKEGGGEKIARFVAKEELAVGDRLRLHQEPSGERIPLRLKSLFVAGNPAELASSGTKVSIAVPSDLHIVSGGHIDVYKIDSAVQKGRSLINPLLPEMHKEVATLRKTASRLIGRLQGEIFGEQKQKTEAANFAGHISTPNERRHSGGKAPSLALWLKVDAPATALRELPFAPERILVPLSKKNVGQAGRMKTILGNRARIITWALPPVITEGERRWFQKQISTLVRTGYRNFQLGHPSQTLFFTKEKVQLTADYTFNLVNSQAVALLTERGIAKMQAAIEMDRSVLGEFLAACRKNALHQKGIKQTGPPTAAIGLTVYGTPALYTSRLAAGHFHYDRRFYSPKNEAYIMKRGEGCTETFAEKPFSLLPYLDELKNLGVSYVVIDLSHDKPSVREFTELAERIKNSGRYGKLSTFNYLGTLE